MRLPVSSLSILILVACTPSANPPAPDRTRIEIELPISKEKAYDRMYRAFIEEGMNIATASPISASLTTVPLPLGATWARVSDPIMEPFSQKITYHGFVIAQSDTATAAIILLGTVRDANFGGGPELKEEPLHSQMKGRFHDAWLRLEQVAARLRGKAPH